MILVDNDSKDDEKSITLKNQSIKSWESEIRGFIQVSSILALVLLLEKQFGIFYNTTKYYSDKITLELFPTIIIGLLFITFTIGLVFSFLHLRWINSNRNKNTNISGLIGFIGLFITLLISIIQFLQLGEEFVLLGNSFLVTFYILGIILALLGFIAEITRIDEPLVFWLGLNRNFIARLFLSSIAIILLYNHRLITFNIESIPFVIGYLLFIIAWLKHSSFRGVETCFSVILLFWGVYLTYHVSNYFSYPERWLAILLIILSSGMFIILWIKEIFTTLKNIIRSIIRFFQKYTVIGIRYLLTLVGIILVVFASAVIHPDYLSFDNNIYRIFGILLIYFIWLSYINLKIVSSGKIIKHILYHLAHSVRKYFIPFLRGLSSFIAIYLIIIGLILLIIDPINGLQLLALGLFIQYLCWFKEINRNLVSFFNYLIEEIKKLVKQLSENIKIIIRNLFIFISVILILLGPPILSHEKLFSLFNISRVIGIIILYLVLRRNFNRIFKVIIQEIMQYCIILAAYTRKHYIKIIRISMTIIGVFLLILGPAILPGEKFFEILNLSRLIGLIIIYAAWLKPINRIIYKYAIISKKKIKELILLVKEHYIEIIRIIATPTGLFLIIFAPPLLQNESWLSLLNASRFIGIILLYTAHYTTVNQTLKSFFTKLALVFHKSALKIYYFKILIIQLVISLVATILLLIPNEISTEIDINITRTFGMLLIYLAWCVVINGFILSIFMKTSTRIKKSVRYIIDKRYLILRRILIFIGIVFIIFGVLETINDSDTGIYLVIVGILFIYVALIKEINSKIVTFSQSLKKALKDLYASIIKLLSTLIYQIKQLLVVIVDSVFIIVLMIISILILSYGFILFSSGIIGDWTPLLLDNIPWLDSIASILGDENSLLGLFANIEQLIWILLGTGFIIVGMVSSLIVYNNRRNLALNIAKNQKKKQYSSKGKSQIYNGGENND